MTSRAVLKYLLILYLLVSCGPTPTPEPGDAEYDASVYSNSNVVELLLRGSQQPLLQGQDHALNIGDGVTVNRTGDALLTVANNMLRVRALHNGSLTLDEVSLAGGGMSASINQTAGTTWNKLDAGPAVAARIDVETNFAVITATGTEFLVVYEEGTPLEWLIALDAGPSDLTVTSRESNATQVLQTGEAVWVAEYGPPSLPLPADMAAVEAWLADVQAGNPTAEIGEVVVPLANTRIRPGNLTPPLNAGDVVQMGGIDVTLEHGRFTPADCNNDGQSELQVTDGSLLFDLRRVPLRIRKLHATLISNGGERTAVLDGFTPDFEPQKNPIEPIGRRYGTAAAGQQDTLTIASPVEPYHFARVTLADGCFIELGLDHPVVGQPTPTVPAATPTAVASPTPTATFTTPPAPCVRQQPPGWGPYTVQPGDTFFAYRSRSGVSEAVIRQVNCYFGTLMAGDTLWLPPGAGITPTPTPAVVPVDLSTPPDYSTFECVYSGAQTYVPTTGNATFTWQPRFTPSYPLRYAFQLRGETLRREPVAIDQTTSESQLTLPLPCTLASATWRVRAVGGGVEHPWSSEFHLTGPQPYRPVIQIASVAPGSSVTITPDGFPPNAAFAVSMTAVGNGASAPAGVPVGSIATDAAGNLPTTTFAIPPELARAPELTLLLQGTNPQHAPAASFRNVPRTPGGFRIDPAGDTLVFAWDDLSDNEDRFCIVASVDALQQRAQSCTTGPNQTWLSLPQPAASGSYSYAVVACLQGGCSAPSPTLVYEHTVEPVLQAPILLWPENGTAVECQLEQPVEITFSWQAVAGANDYLLLRESTNGRTEVTRSFACDNYTVYWQVQALANGNSGPPSEERVVYLQPVTPQPEAEVVFGADGPLLYWKTAGIAEAYLIQAGYDERFPVEPAEGVFDTTPYDSAYPTWVLHAFDQNGVEFIREITVDYGRG